MDSRKLAKINKNLLRIVGEIIHEEAEVPIEVLVTVARVETRPNLASAEVFLYIYPTPRAEEVVELLRGQLYQLQGTLNRRLDARAVPRIRFTVDYGADKAATIEERLREIKSEGQPTPQGEDDGRV